MASRTRSSSRSRPSKAQFFVLSAFIMVTILFVVSQFVQPSGVLDTSAAAMLDEPYLFNDIKEKSVTIVKDSESCADLSFNLAEYKQFLGNFVTQRNDRLTYSYDLSSCTDAALTTRFYVALVSPRASADSTFTASK